MLGAAARTRAADPHKSKTNVFDILTALDPYSTPIFWTREGYLRWWLEDDAELRRLFEIGESDEAIAAKLGRGAPSVTGRRSRLNIRRTPTKISVRTAKSDETLLQRQMRQDAKLARLRAQAQLPKPLRDAVERQIAGHEASSET